MSDDGLACAPGVVIATPISLALWALIIWAIFL